MTSETPRAAYHGELGTTRTARLHVTCRCDSVVAVEVHRGVDVSQDPELALRLASPPGGGSPLNVATCDSCGRNIPVEIPVVYHDPRTQLFVLVLPDSLRHAELEERVRLLQDIAEDKQHSVPRYVREFPVAFGPDDLRREIERRSEAAPPAQPDLDNAALQAELRERGEALEARARTLDEQARTLAERAAQLDRRERAANDRGQSIAREMEALTRRRRELDERAREIDRTEARLRVERAQLAARVATDASANEPSTDPFDLVEPAEIEASDDDGVVEIEPEPVVDGDVVVADPVVEEDSTAERPQPLTSEGATRVGGKHDVSLERWVSSGEETLIEVDESGTVRLAACASQQQVGNLSSDDLQLRLQLHRLPTYPLLTVAAGTIPAFAGDLDVDPFCFHLDVGDDVHRAVLESLSEDFTFVLELHDADYHIVRRRTVSAGFSDNARYLLRAADDHLASIPVRDRSCTKAIIAHSAPDYDTFARHHHLRREFRDDLLQALDSPKQVLDALSIARKFSLPANEDYLIALRGYPLGLWHHRRRSVVVRAVEGGLWLGPELDRIAVSEGLARSRKDLALRLQRHFAHAVADSSAHDLDEATIQDNWSSLRAELTALGLDAEEGVRPRTDPIASDESDVASGTIGRITALGLDVSAAAAERGREGLSRQRDSAAELIEQLAHKETRLSAAFELAARGEVEVMAPVFEAIGRMTRGEAGRVLGRVVRFGAAAVPHLIEGLRSHKGFIRQGSALALGVLKEEAGIAGICDQLLIEPTEIWREMARAIGEVGSLTVAPLATRLATGGEEARERVAWALAHVAARGGRSAVESLSKGRHAGSAGVARHALELVDMATADDLAVRGHEAPRDQTVNRAFSRRFFEAMQSGEPLTAAVIQHAEADRSAPAMMLDEADLIEASDLDEEPEEALDESDRIST